MLMRYYLSIFSRTGLPKQQWAPIIVTGGKERCVSLFLVLFTDLKVGSLEKNYKAAWLVGQLDAPLQTPARALPRGPKRAARPSHPLWISPEGPLPHGYIFWLFPGLRHHTKNTTAQAHGTTPTKALLQKHQHHEHGTRTRTGRVWHIDSAPFVRSNWICRPQCGAHLTFALPRTLFAPGDTATGLTKRQQ